MSNYSSLDQILHKLFLGKSALSDFFYKRLIKQKNNKTIFNLANHVFITGLARAGTTSLLNKIYSSNEIPSITYNHMPFILSPFLANLFNKYISNQSGGFIERFHNDGIKINIDSPECLDESFWVKAFPELVNQEFITLRNIPNKLLIGYSKLLYNHARFQNSTRLLIKNNNNHIRLFDLVRFFPKAYFLVMVRNPLAHSKSLLNQNINFIKIKKKNSFVLDYMNYLGHYEFGLNSKTFVYDLKKNNEILNKDKKKIEYWLIQWIESYRWILESGILNKKNVFLINYEELCNDDSVYKIICEIIGIRNSNSGLPFVSSNFKYNKNLFEINESLLDLSMNIYEELIKKSISNFSA